MIERTRKLVINQAAMFFAEIGEIPTSFKALTDKYPHNKPGCVQRRTWNKYWKSWSSFITSVKKYEPELCALALNPQPAPEPVEEKKDPLEALRASTTEKTYE